MSHDPRPHIHRRRHAIGRLQSLTTGAAIAGLAGTAGFGILAAATWSGNAQAADEPSGATSIVGANGAYGGDEGAGDDDPVTTTRTPRPQYVPNTGGTAQQPTTITPRVQRVSGSGHASTGGSH
jgi:hypothetical protein